MLQEFVYEDPIYNIILNRNFPIKRESGVSVVEFLSIYYEKYIDDLKLAVKSNKESRILSENTYVLLNQNIRIIEQTCKKIIKILLMHEKANMKEMYLTLYSMLDEIKMNLHCLNTKEVLYRIRVGNESFSREDLFHIRINDREKIKACRYSIQGYPCLYLSTDLAICWYETGEPYEFSYSYFKPQKILSLLDLAQDPKSFVVRSVENYNNHSQESQYFDERIQRYLITLPLRAACSVEVSNREAHFIEEYIFPQLLLIWLKDDEKFDGISYRTSVRSKQAKERQGFNVVLPAKNISKETGYSDTLRKNIFVSEPIKKRVKNTINVIAFEDDILGIEYKDIMQK